MLATHGIALDRSTLAFWLGYAAQKLKPLWHRLRRFCWPPRNSVSMRPRRRCWIQGAAGPKRATSGRSRAITGLGPDLTTWLEAARGLSRHHPLRWLPGLQDYDSRDACGRPVMQSATPHIRSTNIRVSGPRSDSIPTSSTGGRSRPPSTRCPTHGSRGVAPPGQNRRQAPIKRGLGATPTSARAIWRSSVASRRNDPVPALARTASISPAWFRVTRCSTSKQSSKSAQPTRKSDSV